MYTGLRLHFRVHDAYVSGWDPGLKPADCPGAGSRVPVLQTPSPDQRRWVEGQLLSVCAEIKVSYI